MEIVMKKLVTAAVLSIVFGSPVFAQSYDPSIGTGNLNLAPYRNNVSSPPLSNPYEVRAEVPVRAVRHRTHIRR